MLEFKHIVIKQSAQLVSCAKIVATPQLNYLLFTMLSAVNTQVLFQVFFPNSLFPKEEDQFNFAATSATRNTPLWEHSCMLREGIIEIIRAMQHQIF